MSQTNLFPTGAELRDRGLKQAEDHANEVTESWTERAYNFFINFLSKQGDNEFLAEDARNAAAGVIPVPPSNRAWASIIVRARKNNLIDHVGTRSVKNPKAHCAIVNVWKRKI